MKDSKILVNDFYKNSIYENQNKFTDIARKLAFEYLEEQGKLFESEMLIDRDKSIYKIISLNDLKSYTINANKLHKFKDKSMIIPFKYFYLLRKYAKYAILENKKYIDNYYYNCMKEESEEEEELLFNKHKILDFQNFSDLLIERNSSIILPPEYVEIALSILAFALDYFDVDYYTEEMSEKFEDYDLFDFFDYDLLLRELNYKIVKSLYIKILRIYDSTK